MNNRMCFFILFILVSTIAIYVDAEGKKIGYQIALKNEILNF